DESLCAGQMASFFKLKLTKICKGPVEENKMFSRKTNINKYLNKVKQLLKTGSGTFILDEVTLLANYKFGYHTNLEGSAYPTALCIAHLTEYPSNRKPKFDPRSNSDRRFFYSKVYIQKRLNQNPKKDNWNIKSKYPKIHPYYYEFLEPVFYGFIDANYKKLFPDLPEDYKLRNRLNKALQKRGYSIIGKILKSEYFKTNIKKPSVNTAMKLMKIVVYINNSNWAACKLFNYRKGDIFSTYRPGLGSKILIDLLSVEVNEILTNYPKWHLFKAFEILAGKDFFKIHRRKKIMMLKTLFEIILHKINNLCRTQKVYKLRNEIIVNKSVKKFIKQNQIINKFNQHLIETNLKDYINNFNLKKDVSEYTNGDFWRLNNIITLTMCKKDQKNTKNSGSSRR
ncbi:MAG: hypothetical protein ACLFPQ_01250, partial [Candidatus Woesearchaeota archaeon]